MTSVNTNVAAITALRTLQQTNNQLDATQGRISTGLKIGEAKDNAAYWAISTTLKSDNKSLGTVKDALGLGSATVDVAYQGLNKAKDVLDEIKSKLTAASQAGVDKNVIQAEIGELQKQLVSIAGSSVFSGENWLSVDSSATDYNATKKIVASFSRDANNSVTIGTVDVSIGGVALFDSSTAAGAGGIVDGKVALVAGGRDLAYGGVNSASGNTNRAGLDTATDVGTSAAAVAAGGAVGTYSSVNYGNYTPPSATTLTNGGTTATAVFNLSVVTDGGVAADQTVSLTDGDLYTANGGNNSGTITMDELVSAFNTKAATNGSNKLFAFNDAGSFKVRHLDAGSLNTVGAPGTGTALTASYGGMGTTPAGSAYVGGAGEAVAKTDNLTLTTANGLAANDKLDMTFKFDGAEYMFSIAPTIDATTTATSLTSIANALNAATNANGVVFSTLGKATVEGNKLVITGKGVGTDQSAQLSSVVYKTNAGVVKEPTSATGLPYSEQAKVTTGAFTGVTLDADDKIQFDFALNGAKSTTLITIDQALVKDTLSNRTVIASASEYAQVLTAAFTKAKVTGVTAAASGNTVVMTTALKDATAKIDISNVTATKGASQISIETIDISKDAMTTLGATSDEQVKNVISAYVAVVNSAINKITTAASNLGAVSSRIDMQKSFVNTLMDTIDKGVGGLIDADMSEESTKLQALQVKQSLGVQALSIANQSSQNILRLFQ